MIVYDPDSNWIKDILHFYKSKTLVKLFFRLFWVGLYMTFITYMEVNYWHFVLDISPMLYTSVGLALSILLVFRTNTAYDRWWEGRKRWGLLVNHTRHLALILDSKLNKGDKRRSYFARHISNYPHALSYYLRGGDPLTELELEENEKEGFSKHKHTPNYISKILMSKTEELKKENILTDVEELKIHDCYLEFSNITGACERIKNTPIPFSYNTYLKMFIFMYTAALPFAFVSILEYYTVILGLVEFFFLIGVEMLAEEIEDPFEDMSNDLPTLSLSKKMKNDVHEILEVYDKVVEIEKPKLYEVIS